MSSTSTTCAAGPVEKSMVAMAAVRRATAAVMTEVVKWEVSAVAVAMAVAVAVLSMAVAVLAVAMAVAAAADPVAAAAARMRRLPHS